ncbi:MAG TPA: hypothetical protein VHR72_15605 [Gemmataceae bacterium]|jgi:hypothetical protein|nr:hypothetical protein [Gemmataceae bacterium]
MHDQIQAHFVALQAALESTTVTDERKRLVAGFLVRLDGLYTKFRETNASRYGDEIASIVQTILRELEACPEARKLDADFREGLHALHEEFGIPKLALKPAPAPPKPRKKSKS